MNFEQYLISKRIDSAAFQKAEPALWKNWQEELEQMHPNSFTAQKLYLINPVRRKYPLREIPVVKQEIEPGTAETPTVATAKPKPVMRPKPKIS